MPLKTQCLDFLLGERFLDCPWGASRRRDGVSPHLRVGSRRRDILDEVTPVQILNRQIFDQSAMTSHAKSRWANDEDDAAIEAQRKKEKELKKKAKIERQRKLEQDEQQGERASAGPVQVADGTINGDSERPSKRRRLSTEAANSATELPAPPRLLRLLAPEWGPCRHVDNFDKLNHIEEGSYGWVSRARELATGEVVALKKLKMDYSSDGFPVTGLREIQTLMVSKHPNIVGLREVVMGDKLEEYVGSYVLLQLLKKKADHCAKRFPSYGFLGA